MLVERSASLTTQTNHGSTPLHPLASAPPSLAELPRQKYAEVVHMLLEHGADVNARNKNGLTPFVLASQGLLAEVKHVLVQHGANSSVHDDVN
jgi:ankyrin repeat protein